MSGRPGPVTADDLDEAVDATVRALSTRLEWDWHVPAGPLEWTCWETLEHLGDALFFYATQLVPVPASIAGGSPFDYGERRQGGPKASLFASPDAGPAGLLRMLNACGGLLVSLVRTAAPTVRAYHVWGRSDPEGFAAMGVVEVLAHWHDVAGALQVDWSPNEDACHRALARLFPDAPTDSERAKTLLWVTGRGELPRRPRLADWRWYGEPR